MRGRAPEIRYARLSKNGHSPCVNIPRPLLEALGWSTGVALELWLSADCLVVSAAVSRRNLMDRAASVDKAIQETAAKKGRL